MKCFNKKCGYHEEDDSCYMAFQNSCNRYIPESEQLASARVGSKFWLCS